MSGGGSQTSSSGPPAWMQPYYASALNQGRTLQLQGGPQQSAGQVAPMTDLQNQGISAIQGAAGADPTQSAANWNKFVTGGGLMSQNNPYLGAEFQQGAQQVQNQLGSEFGAAGRNILASAPVQSDSLNNLATQLYGGQYDTNLAATNQAAAQAPYIGSGLYTPGEQLFNAGSSQQQQLQNQLNVQTAQSNYNNALPYNSLSWYSSLLGQNAAPFSTTTNTMNNNGTLGGLGGAATGAEMGSALGPWGTAGGALVGGLLGAFS